MKATFYKYKLNFKNPSGTSRGVLHTKTTYFLQIEDGNKIGIGECAVFEGLSYDDRADYEEKLQWVCDNIHLGKTQLWDLLRHYPSIQFGVEQAFLSFESHHPMVLFHNDFSMAKKSIPINGLVWMGTPEFMKNQINQKIAEGFNCIKIKIGAIDFEKELELLQYIRNQFSVEQIEIRVDANGGFFSEEALEKLQRLSELNIHSIEQPIKQNQKDKMAELCKQTPISIALDEELIGVVEYNEKEQLLQQIRPQYIILKPSLVGGFKGSEEWIELAEKYNIEWWITSALESNIGLNAIAQWTYTLQNSMPQGLGTGGLFTNNIDAPLEVKEGHLWCVKNKKWNLDNINIPSTIIE